MMMMVMMMVMTKTMTTVTATLLTMVNGVNGGHDVAVAVVVRSMFQALQVFA